jgi:tetratricopeptide (TPR) repeat protein
MVPNPRFRKPALFLGVIVLLSPIFIASVQSAGTSEPHMNGMPAGNLYREYAIQYFLDRSIQFSKDMAVYESHLAGLTESVVKEIKAREKDGSLKPSDLVNHAWATLPAYAPFNPNKFKDRRINKAYPAWETSQFESYVRSLIRIIEIHDQLIESATPAQKLRMFRREYRLALHTYADEKWDLAILWFDRLLDSYGYRTVDDVLYYRSEAGVQLGYFTQAFAGYNRIIADYPDSPYWDDAMMRAVGILDRLGLTEALKKLYERRESRIARSSPETQDFVHLRLARIWFIEGDWDQTIYHASLVSPASSDPVYAATVSASAWAMKGDYARAIPGLHGVIVDRRTEPAARADATVRLASIYFDMGEYPKCLEIADQVPDDSPQYPKALLLRAWAYFRQNDLQNTVDLTGKLLKYFPTNQAVYEASSLEAYAQQGTVAPQSGEDIFQSVMGDAVKSWKLESAFQEREDLFLLLQEAMGLESAVFMDGRRDLFEHYMQVRSELTMLARRLRIYELWEANDKLRPVLTEDAQVARVARELYDLSSAVQAGAGSSRLIAYVDIQGRLKELHQRLGILSGELLLANPPFLREDEAGFSRTFADKLMEKSQTEMDQLEGMLTSINSLAALSREHKSFAARLQLEEERKQLELALNHLDTQRTDLGKEAAISTYQGVPETHLEEMAEFGFRRTFMSGGLLNRYSFSQSRIDDLNRYLNSINQLLSTQENPPTGGQPMAPSQTEPESPNQ